MDRTGRYRRGFTLLEIMISITILALMALMISRIFTASTRAVERGKARALLDETARMLLDYLEQDISQALIRTNVAFRIHPAASGGDELYFISTGVRRLHETIARDTAPMSWQAGLPPDWNPVAIVHSPANSSGESAATLENLALNSDYYFTATNQPSADFFCIQRKTAMVTADTEYASSLSDVSGVENHTTVTFLEFSVNADPAWNYADYTGRPDPENMPRFVDLTLGLINSMDLEQALRLRNARGDARGLRHIEEHERIYTRRIFMRNRGLDTNRM
jgi:prepilin-type N-terminal cleavage/methylation domain-containing protein